MRVLALDLGSKRIGVAVSDPTGTLASPYEVVTRTGDLARDHRRLAELVVETGAERVVVGLPYSLDGSIGPAARGVLEEVDRIRVALGDVPVETFDERLTTVTAHQRLAEQGRRSKQRRAIVDQAAAAVLLQTWLESPARRAAERDRRPGP
jgi:putative Holliday junction resolvase